MATIRARLGLLRNIINLKRDPTSKVQRFVSMDQHSFSIDAEPKLLSEKIPIFNVFHIDSKGNSANYVPVNEICATSDNHAGDCCNLDTNTIGVEATKSAFYNELGLSARDLRFQHTHMLSSRNNKIILRIQRLKAVICPNAILVIDSAMSTSISLSNTPCVDERFLQFCQDMPGILTSNTLHTKNLPFEYRALEVALTYYINSMTDEISKMEPDIYNLLQKLTDPTNMAVDRSLIHVLLQMNAKLNRFSTIVREYCQMLDEILEYDDELKDMCISVETESNNITRSTIIYDAYVFNPHVDNDLDKAEDDSTHFLSLQKWKSQKYKINLLDEMEILLDSYCKEGEEIGHKVAELKEAIENSNSAILINLDSHRNMLLRYELLLTMGMFSCTCFGMLGMAFGMNLNSSLEEDPLVFWIVSGVMFLGAGVSWIGLYRLIYKAPKKFILKGLSSSLIAFTVTAITALIFPRNRETEVTSHTTNQNDLQF